MNIIDAKTSDQLIMEIALYEATKGHTIDYTIGTDAYAKSIFQVKVDKQFAEFKKQLLAKKITWKELQEKVLNKYAVDLTMEVNKTVTQALANVSNKEPKIDGFAQAK